MRQLIREEELRLSSTTEDTEEEEEGGSGERVKEIGPKADVSLLDQHSRLKKEAEGEALIQLI